MPLRLPWPAICSAPKPAASKLATSLLAAPILAAPILAACILAAAAQAAPLQAAPGQAAPLQAAPLQAAPGQASADEAYPTEARAEFVFACMTTNGQTQEALHRCSCAIDVIASVLPYDKFEDAETVHIRMRRSAGGYLGQTFRSAMSNDMVRDLEEAQAEAEVRCF